MENVTGMEADSSPFSILHSQFLRNMAALWRTDPELALKLDEIDDVERVPLEPTRSGHWTASMPTSDGRSVWLHSRYDPVKEAATRAEAVPLEDKFCFMVGGFGLGYDVAALIARLKGDAIVLVSESSLPLLAAGLCCVDVADAIGAGKLIFFTSDDKARIHERLRPHNALVMLGAQLVSHPASQQIAGEFHGRIRSLLTDFVAYVRMSLVTLVANSQITCRNIANNLPMYVCTPPLEVIPPVFRGRPGIIVSAGPSLRKNGHLLAEARGRAVICAVQTVLKPLLARGVRPHFVTSLDFHEVSGHYFEGVGDLSDVHLIAEPKVTWHVIDKYPGPVSMLGNEFAELLIGEPLAKRTRLTAGATVAHLSFYFLRWLGCDPIIFIGQDLAYTGHVYYAPGVELHATWRSEINRYSTLEMKEWERIVRNRSVLRKTRDIHGREVFTDELLFTYLEQFEKDIAGTGMRVINATEGGAHIHGTEVMTLREALDRYCAAPLPDDAFAYRRTARWFDPAGLDEARSEIKSRLDEVREVAALCEEMLAVLKELQGLTDQPDRFNRRLARVDQLRARLNESYRGYRVINAAAQLSELRRFSADRRLGLSDVTGAERAKRQLSRDVEFVSATRDGAKVAMEILEAALPRFDELCRNPPAHLRTRGTGELS